jgi:hypothetical protein
LRVRAFRRTLLTVADGDDNLLDDDHGGDKAASEQCPAQY